MLILGLYTFLAKFNKLCIIKKLFCRLSLGGGLAQSLARKAFTANRWKYISRIFVKIEESFLNKVIKEILRIKPQGATHVNMSNNNCRAAFTLAEVLITLGIIGIVAAMTIPTLISKYQTKALETGFKKSYAMLMQAVVPIQNEFYGAYSGTVTRQSDFFNALWRNYKILDENNTLSTQDMWLKLKYLDSKTRLFVLKDYAGNVSGSYPGCSQLPTKILADGSAVGGIYNCAANWIVFDVNGAKGPNAL